MSDEPEPIWLVTSTVIDLIPAASGEEAIGKLHQRIAERGLEVASDWDEDNSVTLSEPLSPEVEASAREDWGPFAPRYRREERRPPRPWFG